MSEVIHRVICKINDEGEVWAKCCDKCGAPMVDKKIRNEPFARCTICGFTEPIDF